MGNVRTSFREWHRFQVNTVAGWLRPPVVNLLLQVLRMTAVMHWSLHEDSCNITKILGHLVCGTHLCIPGKKNEGRGGGSYIVPPSMAKATILRPPR